MRFKMSGNTLQFDVAVIGGGPAGMMAVGRAGELGARETKIERGKRVFPLLTIRLAKI